MIALPDALSCAVMDKAFDLALLQPSTWEMGAKHPTLLLSTAGLINDGSALGYYGHVGTQGRRKMGQNGNRRLSLTSEGQEYLIWPIPLGRRTEGRKAGFSSQGICLVLCPHLCRMGSVLLIVVVS